jgi:hypothetical protein
MRNAMNDLYELLNKKDLINNSAVNSSQIDKLSLAQILDLAQDAIALTPLSGAKQEKSLFAHSSSVSLGGGRFPCMGIDCRTKRVQELAQFAAFYSDKIYIRNYFSNYLSHADDADLDTAKKQIKDDISLLLYLRPLIVSGKIIPVTPPNHCIHCLVKESFGADADERFNRVERKLLSRYGKEVEHTAFWHEGKLFVRAVGPKYLLEHPTNYVFSEIPEPIKNSPNLLSIINSGGDARLPRNIVRAIDGDRGFANNTTINIAFELATSQQLGTSYLTERPIDIDILHEISGNEEIHRRNQIIREHLTCLVPIVENVTPSKLLELRNNEEDAFIIFRSALNKTVDEYIRNNKNFTAQDAKAIYGDIIEPKLSKLNSTVRSAKQTYLKNTSAKMIAWGGAITLGVYAGFLPSELVAAAAALGVVPLLAGLANDIMTQNTSEEQVRKEDFYFLWKLSQKK